MKRPNKSSTHQHTAPTMLPDPCCINRSANALISSLLRRPPPALQVLHTAGLGFLGRRTRLGRVPSPTSWRLGLVAAPSAPRRRAPWHGISRPPRPTSRMLGVGPDGPILSLRQVVADEPRSDGDADDPPGDGSSGSGTAQSDAKPEQPSLIPAESPCGGSSRPAGLAPAASGGGVDAGLRRPSQSQGPPPAVPQGRHAPLTRPAGGVGFSR
jgi:hypothetical protein